MPLFITIGYGDRAGYDATAPATRDAAHAHDDRLRAQGVRMGVAGEPVRVTNHDGAGPSVTPGPFLRSDLPVAGFSIMEARDLDEAVAAAAGSPCAVAQGVVEVWPLGEAPAQAASGAAT